MELTQDQINTLKNKGLTDEKIHALAVTNGYSLPQQSTLGAIGSSIIKSEKGFGQSIAGALGDSVLSGTKSQIDQANQASEQIKNNLISTIKAKQAKGEDTSRLIGALKTLDKEVNFYDILNTSTGGSLDKTAKQVYGEGLGVATDIIGAGSLPGGVGSITKANTVGQGIVQGAKAGATGGAIFGGTQGAARAMQDNKTAGEITGEAIKGGVVGGVTGGLVGGVTGGISGAINGSADRAIKDKHDYILDLVSPKQNLNVKEQAIREGRVTEPSLFGKSQIIPSTKDYKIADAVDEVVSPKNTVLQNTYAINRKVTEINDGVKNLIKEKKVPFNSNQLLTRLNAAKEDSKLIFASDTTAENTYNAVVDEFMKHVQKKDTLGLFEARQTFDKIPAIKKLLDSEGLGENVKKSIVLDVRRAANEYIASLLPANNPYRALLRQESLMLEAVGNIAEKSASTIGKNKLQILTQKFPIMKWLIGGAGVGVGNTIINSTD